MAFSEQSLAQARQQGYSDDEIFDHIASSDERFSVAKQQGYSLDDIASHLKQKEGGVNYEDATSQSGQGPLDNRNEQAISGEVQAGSTEGVQADSMLPAEDQSQFRSDEQARVTTGVPQGGELIEGQTKDAQGGIQGQEEGQGLRGQVSTGNEAQVIASQQAAMQAAPFGAEGVQPTPAKSFAEGAFESIRDFGAATLSNIGQSIYGSIAGAMRTEPEYIDLPSIGAKVKNPRFEEQQKIVGYFEGLKKESAEAPEEMGAKPLQGIPKVAAEVTGGLLKIPAQVGTGPLGFLSLIGEAFGSAKEGFYQKAIEKGLSDDEAVKDSESKAIATTAAALPIYYVAVKGAGAIADKIVSESTPKIVDAALRVGLNTVANAIGSATIRGATAALDGEEIGAAVKDISVPGLIQDFAFASHAAVTHFQEQAAKGQGNTAARDLPDPVLEKIAQDPRYSEIVAPEVIARTETRVAQQAKAENLPETAAALETTAKAGAEAIPTEIKPAEAPAEAQPTKPSEAKIEEAGGIPTIEGKPVEPETAVKIEEGVAPREGEDQKEVVAPVATKAEVPSEIDRKSLIARYNKLKEKARPLADIQESKGGLSTIEADEFRSYVKEMDSIRFDLAKPLDPTKIATKEERKSTLSNDVVVIARNDLLKNKEIYTPIADATTGVYKNADTPVDDVMLGKNPNVSPQEFYNNFNSTREALRNEFGDTITLYRAEGKQKDKPTKNWATTEEFAREFGDNIIKKDVPIENILAINTGLSKDGMYHEVIVGEKPAEAPVATKAEAKTSETLATQENKQPKTYEEAQTLIDEIENELEGRGVDIFKLYNEGSESLAKIGYSPMPKELSEAYKIRDGIGKQDLETNVQDVKSILKNKASENESKRILKEYAIDETDAAGQYMASEYFEGTVKSDPVKQAEKIAYILADERGEMFDELKDISAQTMRDATDIVVGLGNYLGVDHTQSFKKQIASQAVEKLAIEQPSAPQAEPTFIQKAESWADSVIKESSKRVSTGLDPEVLAAYALKGSIVIGRGVRNFGVWSGEMVKQFGEEIRPHLKDIWSRAKSYAEDEAKIQMDTKDYIQRREEAVAGGGSTVMRGVSERLAEQAGEGTAKEYYIQADELVRRKSLSDVEVMEWTESLTPEQAQAEYERAIFAPASDEKTAAIKVKLAARRLTDLEAAGDDAGYAQVVNDVAREITVAAQVLRDARFLYKATPKGFTTLLEKIAEGKNIKIKPEKIAEIEAQFKDFTEAGKRSEAKELDVVNAKSEEEFNAAIKDLEKLRKEGFKKQNALDKTVGGIWPKSGREELIPTLLRGNFLTTMSIAVNTGQNMLKGTFLDVPQKLIKSQYSKVESLLTGKEPKYVFGLEQAVRYYATLSKESPELIRNLFRTVFRQPLPADKPVNIMEIRSALNPMAAIRRLRGIYNKENLQYEGDYGFKEAIKDLLEATTGVTADVFFDLLTATDRPFRQAVMISEASGMATRLGLKGLEKEKFLKLPQRGIENWAGENIKDPAKRAEEIKNLKQELENAVSESLGEAEVTIGGKNVTRRVSNFLNNIAKSNPITSLLVYSNAPYVRFPLNFAVNAFKLSNPELAAVSFFYNAARGNSKKAAIDFSIMASGVALAYAGKYLYDQGVIQTTDSPQTKAQKLSGELGRAGSINLSKLKRIVNGETSDTMPGDKIQRLDRLGLIGVGVLAEADKQEALKKKKLLTGDVSFADALVTRMAQLPVSLSYTMNQTFAKGVAGVVDALTQGEQEAEKLLKNTFAASLSIVMPNELSAISRYISDYTPNLDDPKFMKTLENAVRQRMGMTGDLPVKRGFWGEKVPSTPEGANPIAYHFFDFTKQRKLPSVPATMEIIRLFEKTQDNRIIPAEVQDKIAIKGASYRLSAKDHERYQELVGGERLNRVNKLIDSPSYQSASIDRKADRFSKAIDRGARMGERKFLQELQKSGREAGEVLKMPRKELIRRIAELEKED